ncbi:uncharacterized protein EI97DRAFT_433006 [Westerdykella ornata]|uniref:AGC-kinase C-terminal domain-containing protein n=1 Tax=Westerdykella ornata TaxID=318751 RepID=A0A6A6JKY8_WESOR|nr:uncharacterized protein EI97DRAFT_433006 [Westerdykella ornata]KAF2276773.1 hypothetical protein EI97DRAFT_433006 [Westerdykella ornata]
MAPSNLFAHFRPGHTKRNASSTSLPSPSAPNSIIAPLPSATPRVIDNIASPRTLDHANHASVSPISPYPPQLPPIPRVASQLDNEGRHSRKYLISARPPETMLDPVKSIPYNGGDVDDVAVISGENTGQRMQIPPSAPYAQFPTERPRTTSSLLSPPNLASDHPTSHTSPSPLPSPSNIASNYTKHSKSQASLLGGLSEKFSGATKSSSTPSTQTLKSGKSRLNLRNPMSLLMRRRSGQPIQSLSDESLVSRLSPSNIPPIPDNYDPSIRGRIVHDFSAPRPNRNFSYNVTHAGDEDRGESGRYSPQKTEREHTPIFKEHFDDDTSYEQSQAAIRAETLANNEFLARNTVQSPPSRPPPEAPSRRPPPVPSDSPAPHPELEREASTQAPSTILSPVQEAPSPTDGSAECTPKKRTSRTKSQATSRSRGTSLSESSFVPAGLPAHFTSRASRFSFQIGGGESTQEKMLEERHRRKAAEKAANQFPTSLDEEYDGYDMDDYDMDGDMEEEIPMVGDYGKCEAMMLGSEASGAMEGGTPITGDAEAPEVMLLSADVSASTVVATDLQASISATASKANGALHRSYNAEGLSITRSGQIHQKDLPSLPDRATEDLNQSSIPRNSGQMPLSLPDAAGESSILESDHEALEDDLYFDDGMIQEQGLTAEAADFDENVFDDPSGPLFARKIEPSTQKDRRSTLASNPANSAPAEGLDQDEEQRHSHPGVRTCADTTPQNVSISAYHSALAEAAQRAEAEGRFARKPSVDAVESPETQDGSSMSGSRPSLGPDDNRVSHETAGFSYDDALLGVNSSFTDSYDYSDFDDTGLEDDPMIAEANAEALANDFEGFYGREFGFYASGPPDSFGAYGGYFGSSNLGRSMSGRNAVQEPTLTPITERTESARNSVTSLNRLWLDGQTPSSPGLLQLARMSPYGWSDADPTMTFEGLKRLRKTTFGSTTSLSSSTGNSPRNHSPMGVQYVPRNASAMSNYPIHPNYSSDTLADANEESQEDTPQYCSQPFSPIIPEVYNRDDGIRGSRPESPTLTADSYNAAFGGWLQPEPKAPMLEPSPELPSLGMFEQSLEALRIDTSPSSPAMASSSDAAARRSLGLVSPVSTSSPVTPGGSWRPTHSRKTSTADSVTYVREHDDDSGQDRWVLEKRRTVENGELELIGRETVRGTI